MSLTRVGAALLGVVLCAFLPARAEPPADFSGTWQLDRSRSVLPPRAAAFVGEMTLVIEHTGQTVKIERRLKVMGIPQSLTSTYYTDGREASNLTPRGETVVSRSRWDGTSLVTVLKGTVTLNGRTDEGTDVRRLSEDGNALIVDSTVRRAGQDTPERTHAVFVRK